MPNRTRRAVAQSRDDPAAQRDAKRSARPGSAPGNTSNDEDAPPPKRARRRVSGTQETHKNSDLLASTHETLPSPRLPVKLLDKVLHQLRLDQERCEGADLVCRHFRKVLQRRRWADLQVGLCFYHLRELGGVAVPGTPHLYYLSQLRSNARWVRHLHLDMWDDSGEVADMRDILQAYADSHRASVADTVEGDCEEDGNDSDEELFQLFEGHNLLRYSPSQTIKEIASAYLNLTSLTISHWEDGLSPDDLLEIIEAGTLPRLKEVHVGRNLIDFDKLDEEDRRDLHECASACGVQVHEVKG